ncbi:MAG: signal peptidase II [Planctomycetota bacterium]
MSSPTKRSNAPSWILFLFLTALIGAGDLWTKEYVFEQLDVLTDGEPPSVLHQERIDVIENYFQFEATFNRGAFYGWFAGHTGKLAMLSAVAVLVIVGILFFSLRAAQPPSLWFVAALGLICGGTIGNFYDRYFIGAVRDWIKWYVVIDGKAHIWPNFNIADAGICVGVAILVVLEILGMIKDRREAKAASAA